MCPTCPISLSNKFIYVFDILNKSRRFDQKLGHLAKFVCAEAFGANQKQSLRSRCFCYIRVGQIFWPSHPRSNLQIHEENVVRPVPSSFFGTVVDQRRSRRHVLQVKHHIHSRGPVFMMKDPYACLQFESLISTHLFQVSNIIKSQEAQKSKEDLLLGVGSDLETSLWSIPRHYFQKKFLNFRSIL